MQLFQLKSLIKFNLNFNFRPEILSRKSRSLEHILDNTSSSSSGSTYDQLAAAGLTTLPRLRRCDQNPGMWRAAYNTDTMRSCKSVASIKSVQVLFIIAEVEFTITFPELINSQFE